MPRTKKRKLEAKTEPDPEPAMAQEVGEEDEEEEQQEEHALVDEEEENGGVKVEEPDSAPDQPENLQLAPDLTNPAPSDSTETNDMDDSSMEGIKQLIEPLSKELLCDLLCSAALSHPDIRTAVVNAADADPAHRKIFVHGLGWDTNAEALIAAFSKYGEIEDCNAVRDKNSGKSKGYGFILFKHRSGARAALKEPHKKIGTRMTACQLACVGPVPAFPPAAPPASEYTQRKIYVSNVSADLDPQKLLQFFQRYGEIEEGPLGLDKQTGKPKGFTLFVYKTVESARKALEEPHKNFEGHILHCQKAIDGPKPIKPFLQVTSTAPRGPNFTRNESTSNFMNHSGGAGSQGHLMAPSQTNLPFNQGVPQAAAAAAAAAALNPALGQALTALLATQGAGLGITNLLGTLGTAGMAAAGNQNVSTPMGNSAGHGLQGGYGNQGVGNSIGGNVIGGYAGQPGLQQGYPNTAIGQGGGGRSQQGAGQMGGMRPYMGH